MTSDVFKTILIHLGVVMMKSFLFCSKKRLERSDENG